MDDTGYEVSVRAHIRADRKDTAQRLHDEVVKTVTDSASAISGRHRDPGDDFDIRIVTGQVEETDPESKDQPT